MPTDGATRAQALERLQPFVGAWTERVALPDAPLGRMDFEWALDGQFLLQRSETLHPDFPDSIAIIAVDAGGEGYTQHYFDSRGVVRIYAMNVESASWTLVRDAADFTPLKFSQRYAGEFSEDGTRIVGAWERSHDGTRWDHDFDVTYTRVP